ncbi:endonuclease MutS2 [Mariniplasma anaerobium]|uniref:Endonuclease MutS2 n=1 Tax=Mariniplasma anaerobium TaxID=2735436 RepID=A0A7U9TLU4_9MOLU|nr:endonuclease MutS2 [Mariniplasma anaerobium]BCR35986.1 endonuclease MutS2 [Mariniplasma anaerobium]
MRFMTKTLELDVIIERILKNIKSDSASQNLINLTPYTDIFTISSKLDEVVDMLELVARLGTMPFLANFDIYPLIHYAEIKRTYTIQDLLYIRLFLVMERDILAYLKQKQSLKIESPTLSPLFSQLSNHRYLLDYMSSKIDEDGVILDDATPKLLSIRKDLSRFDKQLQDKLQKMVIDYQSYLNDANIVMRNDRFCIGVKEAFKHKIKGVIHDMSASKQTIYIEPEQTRSITAHIESLKVDEQREIDVIIASISEQIQEAHESLKYNIDILVNLDLIHAKAIYALDIDGHKPNINKDGFIQLIKAKHPLLNPKEAVPIDLTLDKNLKTLLITGPNTGGKTVALKTLGLLTLMTQIGVLAPLNEASNIAIFDQVFADIGDEQSISQSLSTFSSHLTKIINMISEMKDNTLVLLDEIGSGTDPNEGVALAISILEAFKAFDARMMVTTHYSELKSYAFEQPHMTTASVAFDKKTLKPLYYLQMGTTGSSHAFLIAKRLGLKDEIVNHALKLYEGRQTDLAKMMEKLNDEMVDIQKEKETLNKELILVKNEKKHYETVKNDLLQKQDQMIEKVKHTEETKWLKLRDEASNLIELLKEKSTLTKPEIAELKYRLNQNIANDKSLYFEEELNIGDEVFITSYQQYGKIVDIKDDLYRVKFGQFDLKFKAKDIKKEKDDKPKKKKTVVKSKQSEPFKPQKQGKMEVDLRGFRFEEVKAALDDAIDGAMISGLTTLRIIHGFGTGAVRKAVHQYIQSSPYIKDHRFGGEGEGLNGVTIVTLK